MNLLRKIKLLLLLFIFSVFVSCESEKIKTTSSIFFDLKLYFENQETMLHSNKIKLKKVISKDSITEYKYYDTVDWKEELKPFAECDLNKPSWKNSYSTDSVIDNGMLCIKYEAKDSVLKIKKINLCFEHDSLTLINIEKRMDNPYFDYTTSLNYFPMKAYSITNSQKIVFTKVSVMEVKGIFIY